MSDIKEIIEKHLGFLGGTDDKWWLQSSIDYYRKAGKPSGSLYKAVEECMKDYLNSQQPKAVITTIKEVCEFCGYGKDGADHKQNCYGDMF